ncbi:MAG TPA: metallophosphoesterase [Jatrophihabitans sp.]|jgi:hypothetical protein
MIQKLSAITVGLLVVLAILVEPVASSTGGSAAIAAADPTIAAAGDIGCGPSDPNYNNGNGTATACRMKYTSNLLVNGGYSAVLALGDTMQSDPSPSGYATAFAPTWGRVKSLIHPVPGNHEYGYSGAQGYFGYFGSAAGDRAKGYYSFDVGAWHIVALNSNCAKISGGCASGGAQDGWLRADLAAHPGQCILAVDHHPRYSSGHDGDNTFMQPLFQDLLNAHADILLSGHSHDYERFQPQDNASHLDAAGGITQFVVGTGGAFFTGLGTRHPNSVVSQNSTFGVLALTLHPASYTWRFVPEAGKTWTDSGSRNCHAATPPPAGNDFSVSVNPTSTSVGAGTSGSATVSTSVTSGAAQNVTLSASGLPTGASASFAPATVTAGGSAAMTITTTAATAPGTYLVTVTGTGASATHSTTLSLTVSSATGATPALVRTAGATESAAATTLTATMPAATGGGDLLVAQASVHTGATNPITSITDSAGNTWTRVGRWSVSGHYSAGELWYSTGARPTTSVTARLGTAAVAAMRVSEYSGVATSGPLVTSAGTANTGTSAASGSVTPPSGSLVVATVAGHGSTQVVTMTTPGLSAFSQVASTGPATTTVAGGYRIGAGTSLAATATFGSAMYWAAAVAVFRAA